MATSGGVSVGRVVGICRYPVKSMMAEELNATFVTERGLLGDRAFALIDVASGKVASAKNPRRWPTLFDFRAAFVEPLDANKPLPHVRIALPNGESLTSGDRDAEARLASALGRAVRLSQTPPAQAQSEGYWPNHNWLPHRDKEFDFPLPAATFFDGAAVHLVTTATLDRLRALSPASRFEIPRFRPNFVIEMTGAEGFVENGWNGKTLTLGNVQLRIDGPCPRCVMTTLEQGTLPKDSNVLRTAVKENEGNVGVYASVVHGGRVGRGENVELS